MLKRVGPVLAGLALVGALAIAVPTATGHPEECSEAAAWSNGTGYSPYASWEGAEICGPGEAYADQTSSRLPAPSGVVIGSAPTNMPRLLLAIIGDGTALPGSPAYDAAFEAGP